MCLNQAQVRVTTDQFARYPPRLRQDEGVRGRFRHRVLPLVLPLMLPGGDAADRRQGIRRVSATWASSGALSSRDSEGAGVRVQTGLFEMDPWQCGVGDG